MRGAPLRRAPVRVDGLAGAAARRCALVIAAAGLIAPAYTAPVHTPQSPRVIVVRRGWHIDVGFAVTDLDQPLRSIASQLPTARFIFFGFGDMHYLVSKNHGPSTLAAALWPGRGIMLVTGLDGTPEQGFGSEHVVALDLDPEAARSLQAWVWNSFVTDDDEAPVYRQGPYPGSLYYLARSRYSALHTCNTWAAQALEAGGLRVHSTGVLFAGQLWSQVRRLSQLSQLHGGLLPFWQTTVVPELPGGTTTVVFSGGGGLELLMQPASRDAVSNALKIIFTMPPVLMLRSGKDAVAMRQRKQAKFACACT